VIEIVNPWARGVLELASLECVSTSSSSRVAILAQISLHGDLHVAAVGGRAVGSTGVYRLPFAVTGRTSPTPARPAALGLSTLRLGAAGWTAATLAPAAANPPEKSKRSP
jgi:hypothetical protein